MNYSLTTNSFIVDIAYQGATTTSSTTKVPVWWTAYMVAPTYANSINYPLAIQGVQQAFSQSAYIKKSLNNYDFYEDKKIYFYNSFGCNGSCFGLLSSCIGSDSTLWLCQH